MRPTLCILLLCATAFACPKQRADVKNLTDAAAAEIPKTAETRTIAELTALPRPAELVARTENERKRFEVTGTITKIESEKDGDMKVFLADGEQRIVVELPETECVAKPYRPAVNSAKKKMRAARIGDRVRVSGVGYFGYVREGETATNGIQIHPALTADVVEKAKK
jgi:hypothetical protein